MRVFAFDRDRTIDVNPPPGKKDAVPIEWVQTLAQDTDHEVWAIGNQDLVDEAGIPGDNEARKRFIETFGSPQKHIQKREVRSLQYWVDKPPNAPDPDLIDALVQYEEDNERPTRHRRVRIIQSLFPEANDYIVVDNRYLGFLQSWTHYQPWEFVEYVEDCGGIRKI